MLTSQRRGNTLSLAGELQVHHLDGLQDAFWEAARDGDPLEVDLSGLRDVDTAGLQMLLALALARQGLAPTRLVGAPRLLQKAMDLSGLTPHLAPFMG